MILGLTGGISSGKSSVAERFVECGAILVSADMLAREVVNPGSPVLDKLVETFGEDILTSCGSLDRDAMAEIIFSDPEQRKKLEAITHPAIAHLADCRLAELRKAPKDLVIYEAPLLFEAGGENRVDQVLVVAVSQNIQEQRLMKRDGLSLEEAKRRISAQWPQADKIQKADFVIDNSGTLQQMQTQVDALYHYLTEASTLDFSSPRIN